MTAAEPSITCPVCGKTSHNPTDIRTGYCGACHDWTGVITLREAEPDRPMCYDRQGHPITMARWAWLRDPRGHGDDDYLRVALDEVDEVYTVSTVWLGLDHSFGHGPPQIFETMTFLSGTVEDTSCQRYATEDQARAGHEAVVAEIRVLAQIAADRERIDGGD